MPEQPAERVVHAEWALWGKHANVAGYRILRCSDGRLKEVDFHNVIGRYASGVKGKGNLPQYTVYWIPGEDGESEYIGVGIHELADPDPLKAGGRVRASRGREIEYTRLFCVPYRELARHQAGYQELIEAVGQNQLPEGLAEPIAIGLPEIDPAPPGGSATALAETVAALLLTTKPVYLIGAEDVTAEERMRFIDGVMALLPYGLRSRLSASTWASSTASDLKLRLFFTNARRSEQSGTCLTWGEHVVLDLEAAEQPIRHYVSWLEHGGRGALHDLAEQTSPARFAPDDIRQLVAGLPRERPVEDVLEELADGLRRSDLPVVQAAVKRLRSYRRTAVHDPATRMWFRQEISRLRLFDAHQGQLLKQTVASAYRVLLALAFEEPLAYDEYLAIVDCADGQHLHTALARAVQELEFDGFVPWLLTMRTPPSASDTALWDHLRERGRPPAGPVAEVRRDAGRLRREHRAVAYDSAVRYLRDAARDPRAELRRLGFLSTTVALAFPGDEQAQRIRLEETLRFVYRGRDAGHQGPLVDDEVRDAYDQLETPPTPAFDAAIERLRRHQPPAARTRVLWPPQAITGPQGLIRNVRRRRPGARRARAPRHPRGRAPGSRRLTESMNALKVVRGLGVIIILAIAVITFLVLHTYF